MFLHELHNEFFSAFENRIPAWNWDHNGSDARWYSGTTAYIPIIYPFAQPTNRKVLGEYNTNDEDKQIGYPFISIDPLQFYRDDTIVYNDEWYSYSSDGSQVSTYNGAIRFIFPYRVTGVSSNLLDHTILQMSVLEQVFPYVRGMRTFCAGTTNLYLERDDAEETKDETTGVHQFSAIFKVYIHLSTGPVSIDPAINLIRLNLWNDAALAAGRSLKDPKYCNSVDIYCNDSITCNYGELGLIEPLQALENLTQ